MLNVQYIDIEPANKPKAGVGLDPDPSDPTLWEPNPLYDPTERAAFEYAPSAPDEVLVDPDGGPPQELNQDFRVVADGGVWYLSWSTLQVPTSTIWEVSQHYPVRLRLAYEF